MEFALSFFLKTISSTAGEASAERVDWRELTPCLSDKLLDLAHLRG